MKNWIYLMLKLILSFLVQNDLRLEDTFLTVDQFVNGRWAPVRSDSHPSTRFEWLRTITVRLLPFSAPWVHVDHSFRPLDIVQLTSRGLLSPEPYVSASSMLGRRRVDILAAGTYRLTYFGDSKSLTGSISSFTGHSSSFMIA